METVSSILANHLKKWGVSHVFGIPGKAVVPLIVEIDNKGIEFVLSKHECAAGYEAAGYALFSRIGVAIGTSGPGGTNLVTAAGQAKASHIPIIIITGHPSISDAGKALGQDSTPFGTDLVEMFRPVTKFSTRIERGDQVESILTHALEKAFSGVKGPVHLTIPADVLLEKIVPFSIDLPEPQHLVTNRIEEVIDIIHTAKRPVMFLGKGVHSSSAYEETRIIAEHWNIPVMTTPGGKGTFVSNHPLSLGAFGLGGHDIAHEYIDHGVDVMIVMGTKLSDMSLAGLMIEQYPLKVIHFDYDHTFVGKSLRVPTYFVPGDLKSNLQLMISHIMNQTIKLKNEAVVFQAATLEQELDGGMENGLFMSAVNAMEVINEILPDETIIFGDAGSHSFYAIKHFDIKEPGTFFFDDVFGAMGHAIGYSIGAKLAKPNKPIVCLTGDGCLLMQGSEISTAVNSNSAVLFIVFNNSGLDMVDKGMKSRLGKSVGTTLEHSVNVAEFANSMGALAFKCQTSTQLRKALEEALMNPHQPVVVEIIVDSDEIPPTMRRG